MTAKKESATALPGALGDLTKMFEQFKLPGVDTQELMDARRKDIDALVQANQSIFEGMQALASKQGELLTQAMQGIQTAMAGAAGGVAAGDVAQQGELARKAYEKVLGDMQDLAGIARTSQADALAKITQRGAEHLEEVKKMMNPKK